MKRTYCSTCRHSKYVQVNNIRKLLCQQRQAFGQKPYLSTDCTAAEDCLDYDPERLSAAFTTRPAYLQAMTKCGIPLSEERHGLLAGERLTP